MSPGCYEQEWEADGPIELGPVGDFTALAPGLLNLGPL